MRLKFFAVLICIAIALSAGADEKFSTLKAGNETYSNVVVTTVTATDIYFTHAGGMGNAKLKDLTSDLQKHFHYNETNAVAIEKRQVEANKEYNTYIANQPVVHPPDETRLPETAASISGTSGTVSVGALQEILDKARSDNKLVLLNFIGSDWDSLSIKFNQEIFSSAKFGDYAKSRLELVAVDFPHNTPQSENLHNANLDLLKRFNVVGFPTAILLDASGRELGRQAGYPAGGVDAFIAELENFSKR